MEDDVLQELPLAARCRLRPPGPRVQHGILDSRGGVGRETDQQCDFGRRELVNVAPIDAQDPHRLAPAEQRRRQEGADAFLLPERARDARVAGHVGDGERMGGQGHQAGDAFTDFEVGHRLHVFARQALGGEPLERALLINAPNRRRRGAQ